MYLCKCYLRKIRFFQQDLLNILAKQKKMLLSKDIKQMFCTIIMFKGRMSFNPNTLNNNVSTYFLADHWQQKNSQGQEGYTYENWIKMVNDGHNFYTDINKIMKPQNPEEVSRYNVQLFNDWSVYGTGMVLAEYQATAMINTNLANPITIFREDQKFPITSKMGQHKAVLSDQDTDSQTFSKLYGFQLRLGTHYVTKLRPTSFRHMSLRIENAEGPFAAKADWFMTGKMNRQFGAKQRLKSFEQNLVEKFENKEIYFRKSIYRYNHHNKVSSIFGYLTKGQVKQSNKASINTPNMQGWRKISLPSNSSILIKQTNNGILLDVGNAIYDLDNSQYCPVYPSHYSVKIFNSQGLTYFEQSLNIQEINDKQGGLTFVKCSEKLSKVSSLKATVQYGYSKQILEPIKFGKKVNKSDFENKKIQGEEAQYFLCVDEASVKSKLSGDKVFSEETYLNETQLNFYCTRFGTPVSGEVELQLRSSFSIDNSLAKNFDDPYTKMNDILQNPQVKQKYISFDNINQTIFQGKLDEIQAISLLIKSRTKQVLVKQKTVYLWKIKGKQEVFQLKFNDGNKAYFQDGKASVKFGLNQSLTSENNPRSPVIKSLAIEGYIRVKNIQHSQLRFSSIFYETDKIQQRKVDWAYNIAPILKKMGLMYPTMQKIVNLYDFQKMSMNSMKRAFDIEDEEHPRYMPSTRQLSAIEHRKIRKWLYQPLYNSWSISYGTNKYKNFISNYCIDQKNRSTTKTAAEYVTQFKNKKEELTQTLKIAFNLQLSTIPLYLSAMFSVKDQQTKKLIRTVVIDEMKHLFIVSNVLNAIHDPKSSHSKAVPYTDSCYIPEYPIKELPVLKVKDKWLQQFLQFDILPCTPDQILRFACIQLPGQLDYLKFEYQGTDCQRITRIEKLNMVMQKLKYQDKFNPQFKTIGEIYSEIMESFWYISDLETFINVKLESEEKVSLFTGDPRKQFTYFGLEEMAEVYDLRSALNQFRLIVDEGEGANLFTNKNELKKQSHFIKFIEIYTGCQVQTKTQNSNTIDAKAIMQLTDHNFELVTDKYTQSHWTAMNDRSVDKKINIQFCAERSQQSNYQDFYAKPSFLNAYQKIMKQFDFIFNTDLEQFKKYYIENVESLSQQELRRRFEVARRAKMENGIAKMRQMTLHADRIIEPLGRQTQWHKKIGRDGARPDFNINFDKKESYKCPTTKKK